jgi:phosphopantothenoylcysteine decarboxylase / phosphopantothenate---cysteine ligase
LPRVVLGVCGGIAAYKSVELLRLLKESGHTVTVIPTENALRFVGAATFEALSGEPVSSSVWTGIDQVRHIDLGESADIVVIAPATADFIARATHGIASDLLTNTLLGSTAPVVIAPAMHTQMWQHAATQHNVSLLRERGYIVVEPDSGRLTGKDSGVGRLPSPQALFDQVQSVLAGNGSALAGRHIVITAGGTRESWDPVRFVGNRSSGKQGVSLARAALACGARVTLIAGFMEVEVPAGVTHIPAESAADMLEAVRASMKEQPDALIMAAAVADYRPLRTEAGKIKKDAALGTVPSLDLAVTEDILASVTAENPGMVIIGFAAETAESFKELVARGRTKLASKGCSALIVNNVSNGKIFGSDQTEVVILLPDGKYEVITGSKDTAAHAVVSQLVTLLGTLD